MVKSFTITLVLLLAFALTSLLIPADTLTEMLSVAVLIAAFWGLARWGGAGLRAYMRGAETVEAQGVLGVTLLLLAIIAQRVYSFLYLRFERPEIWQTLHILPFIAYVSLIALVLFINATKYPGEHSTPLTGTAVAVITFLAVMLSSIGPIIVAKLGAIMTWLLARLA